MNEYKDKLHYALVEGKYIDEKVFKKAFKESERLEIDVVDYLINNNLLNIDLFGQAVAEAYNLDYADINSNVPSKEQIMSIPEDVAKDTRAVLYQDKNDSVIIATSLPKQKGLIEKMAHLFPGKKIKIEYSVDSDIEKLFLSYDKPLAEKIDKIIKENKDFAPIVIDEIFNEALMHQTSDIHIEPQSKNIRVRFRIDGRLQERTILSTEVYENILNRIKVLAQMRIDEHHRAQDGSIRYSLGDKDVDLRVSIAPTLYGEKIVIRILRSYISNISLEELGLRADDKKVIQEISKKPFGMIINVGPTGSGKTTTLYSILKEIKNPELNITTIEDPVEYRIDGINQIQINKDRDVTFSKSLRSVVRQDPDVILVGEIRDRETAEIAVNAALTGHLLLSTFHANNAAATIPRLVDMGIEPFLLASTVELIIAQRLVRKICPSCKHSYKEKISEINKIIPNFDIGEKKEITLYKGKGCNLCNYSGFGGRIAIFEYIKMTRELKDLILKNPSNKEIWDLALKQGSKPIFEDGLVKVKNGTTTLEELMRVAEVPEHNEPKRKTKD